MLVPIKAVNPFAPGVGVEYVDDEDPRMVQNPLIVEGPSVVEGVDIFRKFCDYRIWHTITGTESGISLSTDSDSDCIDQQIQCLLTSNDSSPEFIDRVDSITLIYPKAMDAHVTRRLAHLPSPLPMVGNNTSARTGKVIHLLGKGGTRSFEIHQRPLDIETDQTGWYVCLNIPDDPGWVVYLPRNAPFMHIAPPRKAFVSQAEYESNVWGRVEGWFNDKGFKVDGKQYPLGNNSFPDYEACIDGLRFDVEITSVPDLSRWTIKAHFRDLENRIRQLAVQPGESKADVINDLNRILAKKRKAMNNSSRGAGDINRCILVISNWSTYDLSEDILKQVDFEPFDSVMLDERDSISCIYCEASSQLSLNVKPD